MYIYYTAYQDPMDHFFTGLGDLEMRQIKEIDGRENAGEKSLFI
jgi:hypothetical protein